MSGICAEDLTQFALSQGWITQEDRIFHPERLVEIIADPDKWTTYIRSHDNGKTTSH